MGVVMGRKKKEIELRTNLGLREGDLNNYQE